MSFFFEMLFAARIIVFSTHAGSATGAYSCELEAYCALSFRSMLCWSYAMMRTRSQYLFIATRSFAYKVASAGGVVPQYRSATGVRDSIVHITQCLGIRI